MCYSKVPRVACWAGKRLLSSRKTQRDTTEPVHALASNLNKPSCFWPKTNLGLNTFSLCGLNLQQSLLVSASGVFSPLPVNSDSLLLLIITQLFPFCDSETRSLDVYLRRRVSSCCRIKSSRSAATTKQPSEGCLHGNRTSNTKHSTFPQRREHRVPSPNRKILDLD